LNETPLDGGQIELKSILQVGLAFVARKKELCQTVGKKPWKEITFRLHFTSMPWLGVVLSARWLQ
jgi:hypothetical protein